MIIQFGFNWPLGAPTFLPVLDCRQYIKGCFSVKAAQKHPAYSNLLELAELRHQQYGGMLAIGCGQGKHRSVAVARGLAEKTHDQDTAYVRYHPDQKPKIVTLAIKALMKAINRAGIRWLEMPIEGGSPFAPSLSVGIGQYKLRVSGAKGKISNKLSHHQCSLLTVVANVLKSRFEGCSCWPIGSEKIFLSVPAGPDYFGLDHSYWNISHDSQYISANPTSVEMDSLHYSNLIKGVTDAV